MKKILKVIAIFVFFSTCQYSKAQNILLLKDRFYDIHPFTGEKTPLANELLQARIIDGFIYTIETLYESPSWSLDNMNKTFLGKYDLNGNLVNRKKIPVAFNCVTYTMFSRPEHLNYAPNISIYNNGNSLVLFNPIINDSTYAIYKVSKDLDSIKLIFYNASTNDYRLRVSKERQFIKTSDNGFLVLTSEPGDLNRNCFKLKLQKYDSNINSVWITYFHNDTTNLINVCNFFGSTTEYYYAKYYSLNEIEEKYYIVAPIIDPTFDPNYPSYDSIKLNLFLFVAYSFNRQGNVIGTDTFRIKKNPFDFARVVINAEYEIVINDLYKDNDGFKLITFITTATSRTGFDSLNIFQLNNTDKTAQLIYIKGFENSNGESHGGTARSMYKKGYIDFTNYYITSTYKGLYFWQINTQNTGAALNMQSVNPLPDTFYINYGGRFQKAFNYRTFWVDENIDTSYLLLGLITLQDSGTFMTISRLSRTYGAYTGNVYKDNNNNCSFDTITDSPYKYRTVEVTKTDVPVPYKYYDFTDANGKFEIFADTGNFSAKVFPNSDLWSACPSVHNFSLNNANDTVIQNFYLQRLVNCPKLSVSIATDRLRSCIDNSYYINYCNRGTADAVDAYVQVTFDSALIVNSASLPYTHVGNVYSFQVGTIKEDSCGQFIVSTTLNCSTPLGITHCVTAHIYPDSLCATVDPRWDRANVAVDGKCLGDSVLFRIRNIGTGNMSVPKQYIVIEDNVLRIIPINFQMNAGQELLIKRPANGTTQRLVAEQTDYFPYPSHPTAVVENCGGLNAGFVNQFPNDDAADFIAVNCTQNIGSFDPNDKNGIPEGINTEHLIEKNTDIDYRIRFQNTGTDTAYDVYILDTLSPKLDVATLQMGAASHAYRYEIYGDGHAILKVVFPGINLVDSFKNEPLSHGFFTYRISQDSTNEKGDIIYNAADIYFDSNQPVKTNTTVHTITDVLFSIISTVIENKWQVSVSAYPNPFRDKCTIEINTKNSINGVFHFTLFNLSGQLIEEQYVRDKVEVAANNLSDNIYLYRIEYAGDLVSAGKIIKN